MDYQIFHNMMMGKPTGAYQSDANGLGLGLQPALWQGISQLEYVHKYNQIAKAQAFLNSSLQNSYKSPARLLLEAAQKKAAEVRSRHPEMQVRRIKG